MTAASQFALVEMPPGAILLDLQEGTVFSLNDSATLVWREHLRGCRNTEIASALSEHYGVPTETASRDVRAALELPTEPPPPRAPSDFKYERVNGSYAFRFQGDVVFEIEETGASLVAVPANLKRPLSFLLQAAIPKILSLRGQLVLHASAVEVDEGIIAFCGMSGAGKTTTARAFGRRGARLVCEDKLLLRTDRSRIEVPIEAEQRMLRWITESASLLGQGRMVSCAPLDEFGAGPARPLREIGLMDVVRRSSAAFLATRLTVRDGAAGVFHQSFSGSDVPSRWVGQLKASARVATCATIYELFVPDGLSALADAVLPVVRRGSLST